MPAARRFSVQQRHFDGGQRHPDPEAGRVGGDPHRVDEDVELVMTDEPGPGDRQRDQQQAQRHGEPRAPLAPEYKRGQQRQQGVVGRLHGQRPGLTDAGQQLAAAVELGVGQMPQPGFAVGRAIEQQQEAHQHGQPIGRGDPKEAPDQILPGGQRFGAGGFGVRERPEQHETGEHEEHAHHGLAAGEPPAPVGKADGAGGESDVPQHHGGRAEAA